MEWPPDILKKATNDFSDGNRIGEGGFGPVFSGMLWGTKAAIKVLRLKSETDFNERMAQEQFHTEVKVLTMFRHPNLVSLLGYSRGGHRHQQQCLVYEFMQNGSLEDALDPKTRKKVLELTFRLDILRDAARGLVFLHCAHLDMPLVHRDVKSANVLLDEHFNAKVGDFGLARDIELDGKGSKTSKVMGTSGYIAPEYLHGMITPKIDVYAFGVMILEVITCMSSYDNTRKNSASLIMYVREKARFIHRAHHMKDSEIEWPAEVAEGMSRLASLCLQDKPDRRPVMQEVLECIGEIKAVSAGHHKSNSLLSQLMNGLHQRIDRGERRRPNNAPGPLEEVDESALTTKSEPVADQNTLGKLVIPGRMPPPQGAKPHGSAQSLGPPANAQHGGGGAGGGGGGGGGAHHHSQAPSPMSHRGGRDHHAENQQQQPSGQPMPVATSAAVANTVVPLDNGQITQQPQQATTENEEMPMAARRHATHFADSLADPTDHQAMQNREAQNVGRSLDGHQSVAVSRPEAVMQTISPPTSSVSSCGSVGAAIVLDPTIPTTEMNPLQPTAPGSVMSAAMLAATQRYPVGNVNEGARAMNLSAPGHNVRGGAGVDDERCPAAVVDCVGPAAPVVFRNELSDNQLYRGSEDESETDSSLVRSDDLQMPVTVSDSLGMGATPLVHGHSSYVHPNSNTVSDRFMEQNHFAPLPGARRPDLHDYGEPMLDNRIGRNPLNDQSHGDGVAAAALSHHEHGESAAARHFISQPVSEAGGPAHDSVPLSRAVPGTRNSAFESSGYDGLRSQ